MSNGPSPTPGTAELRGWWRRLRERWEAWRYPPFVGVCTGDYRTCGCYDCDDYFHNGGKV